MKSFTGRMSSGRRRQVERSLRRAAMLNPVRWELLVPINHTVKELDWFRDLGDRVPFPIEWRGKTWLDARFAEREFIAGYYLGDTRGEVLTLLRELAKEEAGFQDGVRSVMSRVATLVARANQLDPHYRFAIESDGAATKVTVIPRYRGAEIDRPITVEATFAFPQSTEEGRSRMEELERALDFGTPVEVEGLYVPSATVDAPAGLGGSFEGATLTMGPGRPASSTPIEAVFRLLDPSGGVASELPIRLTPRSSGRRGAILEGTDRSGCVHASVVVDVPDGKLRVNLSIDEARAFVPHEFVPAARFFAAYCAPNRVVVDITSMGPPSDPLPSGPDPMLTRELASLVTDLALIQASTGIVREVVGDFTRADAANAAAGAALIRGTECAFPWTSAEVGLLASAPLEARRQMARQIIIFGWTVDAPFVLSICGTLYGVGHRHRVQVAARVDGDSLATLLADPLSQDVQIKLQPDPGTAAIVRLVD